jgi:AraC-like DNA-binding protein
MSVYWVNCVCESYYLHHRINGVRAIQEWDLTSVPWVEPIFCRFADFFKASESNDNRMREDPPDGLAIKMQSALMGLIGDVIESSEEGYTANGSRVRLDRLRPAIDFMDEHYLRNPPIREIAQQNKLTPNYFHRVFKLLAGITPFKYMENRRLDYARKLLFDQALSVKDVAEKSGYHSASYLCRSFQKQFGTSPTNLTAIP